MEIGKQAFWQGLHSFSYLTFPVFLGLFHSKTKHEPITSIIPRSYTDVSSDLSNNITIADIITSSDLFGHHARSLTSRFIILKTCQSLSTLLILLAKAAFQKSFQLLFT